ncbi:hypothetical protein [Marinobacterium sedimentorum]|uniref:spermine/spermidine synthase domain-containing protein n=1 Tax=Marinobacterium sedimentorum TaxID=2927804 RepID=UPI0020C631AF|nr:hypothetical protein [Marinobacterium sedimentorum]MCP8690121.1 hypothetical protein [Marinobacterium sedimentorum]
MSSMLEYFAATDSDESHRAIRNSLPGQELYRAYDEWGPVCVLEDGPRRYLSFGDGGEQSCIDMTDPALPVFEYVQAMLLALLYMPNPAHVSLFGLGGGNLSNCLQAYDTQMQLTVVELRQQVVDIARNWLSLTETARFELLIDDAEAFAARGTTKTDIIFSDLYLDDGMQLIQLEQDFQSDCYNLLNDQGMLVLNLWDQGQARNRSALTRMKDLFNGQCLLCPVNGGNLIVLAFKGGLPQSNPRRLQQQAKQLGKLLGIPLQRLLNQLKPI